MKYPAKNPAKFLKPEPEPDIEAGYPAGSGFSRISGQFLVLLTCFHYSNYAKTYRKEYIIRVFTNYAKIWDYWEYVRN